MKHYWSEVKSRGKKLFIDLGANIGQSIIAFKNWKGLESTIYDVISFEPNIEFINEWIEKVLPHQKEFNSVNLIPAAVGASPEKQLIKFDGWQLSKFGGIEKRNRLVISFDFKKLLREQIGLYKEITIKMDIEGAEYELISELAECKLLSKIDDLFIELHGHKRGYTQLETDKLISLIYANGITPYMWEACPKTNTLQYNPAIQLARITLPIEQQKKAITFNGVHDYIIEEVTH